MPGAAAGEITSVTTTTPILYLVNEFADASVNNLLLSLIHKLDSTRFEFHVLGLKASGGPLESAFEESGAHVVRLGMRDRLGIGLVKPLSRYIHDHHIQIVHTHVLRPDVLGGIAARLAHCPIIISTKHNPSYTRQQPNWLLRNAVYWPTMYLPTHIVTVTELIRQQAINHLHIHPNRVSTIHNGIEIERFYRPDARKPLRDSLGFAPDELVMTFTGRLVGGKGLRTLLPAAQQVMSQYHHVRLMIAGDGPLEAELKRMAQDLGIAGRTVFTGFRTDIPQLLAASDLFVLPSGIEGLPLALLEAMAARKPSVAAISGGTPEVITDGETGLLVPAGDVQSLVMSLTTLIQDSAFRQRLAERGQQHVRAHFSVDHMITEHDLLYQSLAQRRDQQILVMP